MSAKILVIRSGIPGSLAPLQQILARSREQTSHGVLHRFAPYTARAMTARLAKAFAAEGPKGVPFPQIRDLL
jgi:hypothetical protein